MKIKDLFFRSISHIVVNNNRGSILLAVTVALVSLGGAVIYFDVPGNLANFSDANRRLREGVPTNEDRTAFVNAYNSLVQAGGGLPIPGDANDVMQIALQLGLNTSIDIASRPLSGAGLSMSTGSEVVCGIIVNPKSGKPGDAISLGVIIPKPFHSRISYFSGLFGTQSFESNLGLGSYYTFGFTIPNDASYEIPVVVEATGPKGNTVCKATAKVTIDPPDPGKDYVVWYMDNVRCWDAPRVYATSRSSYDSVQYTCNIPGGGIDCSIEVVKKEIQGGFYSLKEAQDMFCKTITKNWYHYWCNSRGPRVETNGGSLYTLQIPCDLSGIPLSYP